MTERGYVNVLDPAQGQFVNVVNYTPYTGGGFIPSPLARYGSNIPLMSVANPASVITDFSSMSLLNVATNGYLALQTALPRGMTVADRATMKTGNIPAYPKGTSMLFAEVGPTGAAASAGSSSGGSSSGGSSSGGAAAAANSKVSSLAMFNLDGDGTNILNSGDWVPFKHADAQLTLSASAKVTADGGADPWYPRSVPAEVQLTWSADDVGSGLNINCDTGHQVVHAKSGTIKLDVQPYFTTRPGKTSTTCNISSINNGRGYASAGVEFVLGDAAQADKNQKQYQKEQEDLAKKNRYDDDDDDDPVNPTDQAKTNLDQNKPVLTPKEPLVAAQPPVDPNPPLPAVPVDPPAPPGPPAGENRMNCAAIRADNATVGYHSPAEQQWFKDNCSTPATTNNSNNTANTNTGNNVPKAPATGNTTTNNPPAVTNNNPPPVVNNNPPPVTNNNPPAVNNPPVTQQQVIQPNRKNCAQIYASGGNYQSNDEKAWFQANCIPAGHSASLNCGFLGGLSSLQRTDFENTWYVQNCAVASQCTAGPVDSGTVPAGSGATRVLPGGCSYSVCLTGTISATNNSTHQSQSFTPSAAHMRANGNSISSCITVNMTGNGGQVTFSCSPTDFAGFSSWGGAFGYTVTRLAGAGTH
jgi:hypothetical protein